jgi:hypothetical protein
MRPSRKVKYIEESALRREPAEKGGASTPSVPVQTTRVATVSPATRWSTTPRHPLASN